MSDDRKKDHIDLALSSRTESGNLDLYYEPLLSAHPDTNTDISMDILGNTFKAPLWISSMTGGTDKAYLLNTNLAKLTHELGLGMGLGSCRPILDNKSERLKDFKLRELIGDRPFYTNLGIAQVEQLIHLNQIDKILNLQKDLEADGLIIHVNPLQEWTQPEGDRFKIAPIETIKRLLDQTQINIIVKEVGQGFGPNSLLSLMKLPLQAIDFASFGGTNFTLLEQSRQDAQDSDKKAPNQILSYIGHTPSEMIEWVNQISENSSGLKCKSFIISGGIKNSIEGFKYQSALKTQSLIGMASSFLKVADDYGKLKEFALNEIENLKLAKCFLRGK